MLAASIPTVSPSRSGLRGIGSTPHDQSATSIALCLSTVKVLANDVMKFAKRMEKLRVMLLLSPVPLSDSAVRSFWHDFRLADPSCSMSRTRQSECSEHVQGAKTHLLSQIPDQLGFLAQ